MSSQSDTHDDHTQIEPPTKLAKLTEVDPSLSATPHVTTLPSTTESNEPIDSKSESIATTSESATRKGRTVLSFGYLGDGYCGLQSNDNVKTIEPVLLEALIKAGAVDANNATLDSIQWDRCARTDKGVSAACNFASLNMRCYPDLIERLNANLPHTMRFWHYQRVGKSFRAHVRAGARRYQYVVPTQSFRPKDMPEGQNFVFDETSRATIQLILDRFVGSHRFHHYTQGLAFKDPQSLRVVTSFTCGVPFMESGIEWVQLTVLGNSFVMNQIRKMVACVISVFREGQAPETVDGTFQNIPHPGLHIAPGEGLYLDECLFDGHNLNVKPPNEPVLVDSARPQINDFVKTQILPSIVQQEVELQVFSNWVKLIDQHTINWEAIVKEGAALLAEYKETSFAEAKRKGVASVRGVATAEEYYQLMKGSGRPSNNV